MFRAKRGWVIVVAWTGQWTITWQQNWNRRWLSKIQIQNEYLKDKAYKIKLIFFFTRSSGKAIAEDILFGNFSKLLHLSHIFIFRMETWDWIVVQLGKFLPILNIKILIINYLIWICNNIYCRAYNLSCKRPVRREHAHLAKVYTIWLALCSTQSHWMNIICLIYKWEHFKYIERDLKRLSLTLLITSFQWLRWKTSWTFFINFMHAPNHKGMYISIRWWDGDATMSWQAKEIEWLTRGNYIEAPESPKPISKVWEGVI